MPAANGVDVVRASVACARLAQEAEASRRRERARTWPRKLGDVPRKASDLEGHGVWLKVAEIIERQFATREKAQGGASSASRAERR